MDTKGLLITGSIGLVGVGGIGYAGYQAISSKSETQEANNILNALKKEGYTPITKDSTKFEAILADYSKIIGTKEELKFGTFNGQKLSTDTKEAKDILLEHCEAAFNNGVSDAILKKARKWCVEPIDVKQLLTNQKLHILDTTQSNSDAGIKAKWEAKIKNYRGLVGTAKVFTDLDVGDGSATVIDAHLKNIKDKCDAVGKILNHNEKYEENLKKFKDWCLDK